MKKAVQKRVQVVGDKFHFSGGGTMFPHGTDAYITLMISIGINHLLKLSKVQVSEHIG